MGTLATDSLADGGNRGALHHPDFWNRPVRGGGGNRAARVAGAAF